MIANFAVTYRCNSRCTTCNIWATPDRGGEELSLGEIAEFFEGERDFLAEVKAIQLTGGEPYLRGDIAGIAGAIWRGIPRAFLWVATNGLLPETIAEKTGEMLGNRRRGGLGVTVSLDGVGGAHDDQRGIRGSYEKSLETLRLLSGMRASNPDLRLSVGMTLTPGNQDQIGRAMRLAEQHGADFTVRPANVSEVYYKNDPVKGDWDREALEAGLRLIAEHHVRRRGTLRAAPVISYLNRIPGYVSGRPRRLGCSAGSRSLFLDPYGAAYPCLFYPTRIGDIREKPLSESWRSPAAAGARSEIAGGRCGGCLVECETMRDIRNDKLGTASALFTGLRYACGGLLSRSS